MSSTVWVGAVNTHEQSVGVQQLFGVQLLGTETLWALLSHSLCPDRPCSVGIKCCPLTPQVFMFSSAYQDSGSPQ